MKQEAAWVRIRQGYEERDVTRRACDKEGRDRRDVIVVGVEKHVTDITSASYASRGGVSVVCV